MSGARIGLCGGLRVEIGDRPVDLPGRQGRLVLAYLAVAHGRPVPRDELIGLLWPGRLPGDPDEALSALLSKIRRALGPGLLTGRAALVLDLPDASAVDLHDAVAGVERAQSALGAGDHALALSEAQAAAATLGRGFLVGDDHPWVQERRSEVEQLRHRALELAAAAGLRLGGPALPAAEEAARELTRAAPLREPGHALLMQALAARGSVPEALTAYEALRVLLRDELGTTPGPDVVALHRRLLDRRFEAAGAPADERKLVTVLLVDGGAGDPEHLRSVLSAQRAEIETRGGTVLPVAGPALLAVFGAPRTRADDAERAVRAAHAITRRAPSLRAAVASGEALVGADGTVSGDVLRVGFDLLQAAAAGAAVADRATREAARDTMRFDSVGRALGPADPPAARPRTPFVGREHELALLHGFQAAAVEAGRPRLVTVIGDAGVGKSRLVAEFVDGLCERGAAAVHVGRCPSYCGGPVSTWPLLEALWDAAGIAFDDPRGVAAEKLAALVRRALPDTSAADVEHTIEAIATGAGIALDGNRLSRAAPETVAEQVGLAWPRLLSGLAARRPTVLVLEDLHWCGPPLLDTIERIASRSDGPLLVVVTGRPELAERRPGWTTAPWASHLGLEPLADAQLREVVAHLLPRAPEPVRRQVTNTAEGNPFFAEEIARHLLDTGAAAAGGPIVLPNGVRALLAARIDALAAEEKRTLQEAAVVGRSFWLPALERIRADPDAARRLAALEERGLVVARPASRLPGQTEFAFRHALIREAAYLSIPRAQRCRAHAAVADWLEAVAGERRDEFAELIADHREAAASPADAALAWPEDEPARETARSAAVGALVEAGRLARRRAATSAALGMAERALALASTPEERLAAVALRARTLHAALQGDESLSAYLEAIDLARTVGDRAAVQRLRGLALLLGTRYMGAFRGTDWRRRLADLVDQGLAETDLRGSDFATGALLLGRSWGMARWTDAPVPDAARADVERAIAIAERIGSQALLHAAIERLVWLVFDEGHGEARALGERLEQVALDGATDPVEGHESLCVASVCFARAGDWERAAAGAHLAMRRSSGLGRHRRLHAAWALAHALVPPGRLDELRAAAGDLLALASRDPEAVCMTGVAGLAGYAAALFEVGDCERGEAAVALVEQAAERTPRAASNIGFACEVLWPHVAAPRLERMLEAAAPHGTGALARIALLRAWLPLAVSEGDEARVRRLAGEAATLARRAAAPALALVARWAEAAVRQDQEEAERALALLQERGERLTAARLRATAPAVSRR